MAASSSRVGLRSVTTWSLKLISGEMSRLWTRTPPATDRMSWSASLSQAFGSDVGSGRPALAPREVEVLLEWFQSESKAMVGQSLGISVRTVNTYLDRVRIKYANAGRPAPTKANLVARAIQDGWVSLDEL